MEGAKAVIARVIIFVAIIPGAAQIYADEVSLPLQGYFHPGRAMPVKWGSSPSGAARGDLDFFASDAITAHLNLSDKPNGIVPWIVIDPDASDLHWRSSSGTTGEISGLHPLDESDCLVADMMMNNPGAGALFPNRRIISIHLDPEELRTPAMAWETLDAILLGSEDWQKLPPSLRQELFSEGIALVVAGDSQPDEQLPWRRSGPWWIASSQLKLPPMINPAAYAPTEGWTAGRGEAFRRRIFLFGAIYCLIAGGACLWRSRWMPAGFVAVSIVAGAAFAIDNVHQSPIFQRSGTVLVKGDTTALDNWVYQVSHRSIEFRQPVKGIVHAMFSDESQAEFAKLILDCNGDGEPVAIEGQLQADEPLALMTRQVAGGHVENSSLARATSPLRLLADESVYPEFRVAGQLQGSTGEGTWPTVVFAKSRR